MEAKYSSKISVLTRAKRRHITDDGVRLTHRRSIWETAVKRKMCWKRREGMNRYRRRTGKPAQVILFESLYTTLSVAVQDRSRSSPSPVAVWTEISGKIPTRNKISAEKNAPVEFTLHNSVGTNFSLLNIYIYIYIYIYISYKLKQSSQPLVSKRTIPTRRPPLVC
jgi:hypothetical protein